MPRILLVEDNEMNRDMLSRRLRRQGFEVAIAADGPRGLDAAGSTSFDLILMDLSLPGIDGWEVARLLKTDPKTRPIPIIALTAHAMAGDRERAIQAGCDDYEIKPIEFPRLLAKIQTLIRRKETLITQAAPTHPSEYVPEPLSQLRHDLISPLSRILGYCELHIDDAIAQGRTHRTQSLRSIRIMGNVALEAIDQSLIRNPNPDLASLVTDVIPSLNSILRAVETLESASSQVSDRVPFLEDLTKLRQDTILLIEMIQGATTGVARALG